MSLDLPVFKRKEFEMWGNAIIRLIRNKRNGAKVTDFEGNLKGMQESMTNAGIEAGMEKEEVKETVKVVSLTY